MTLGQIRYFIIRRIVCANKFTTKMRIHTIFCFFTSSAISTKDIGLIYNEPLFGVNETDVNKNTIDYGNCYKYKT